MHERTLRAGVAVADMTPTLPVALAGSMNRRDATGVLDPLNARALVLENDGTRLVFVLLDFIGLLTSDCLPLRESIARELQTPLANVWIACTHTHTAPSLRARFDTPRETAFLEKMKAAAQQATLEASQNLVAAEVGWGVGEEARPQYNRRYHMRDGSVQMNPHQTENILRPSGPTDPAFPLLFVRRRDDGKMLSVLGNYSLHYIGDFDMTQLSADYFADFAAGAQQRFGAQCIAMLSHGTSGDINNINFQDLPEPWYPAEMKPREKSRLIVGWLLDEAERLSLSTQWHSEAVLAATQDVMALPVRKLNAEERALAEREVADESLSPIRRGFADLRLEINDDYPPTIEETVASWRIGDWGASAFPAEMFCQFGIDVKHASPFPVTATLDLTNGYCFYVPTRIAHAQGGYETWMGSSVLQPGSGEEMTAVAACQLHDLWLENDAQKIAEAQRLSHTVIW